MLKTLTAAVTSLALLGSGGAAFASDISAMTDDERAAFRDEVRAYLLENPDVIFEAIQIYEDRRAAVAAQADAGLIGENAAAIFDDGFSYVGGNPDGDVTVVEFLDYRCGYCKRAHPEVKELVERDPNVRLIVKEFPILGPASTAAGKMALAALDMDRERYPALSDRLMSVRGQLTETAAYRIAAELGFDIPTLKDRARSLDIEMQLQQTYRLAQTLGLQGTPSFIIGNQIVRGYVPIDSMLESVEQARAVR